MSVSNESNTVSAAETSRAYDLGDLKEKITEAKRRMPLPELMARLGLGEHAKESAHCPFHGDEHKSFSVFKGKEGWWHWKCFAGCGDGDEIRFVRKLKGLSVTGAMSVYLEMAGFPASRHSKSHECPKSREYPKPHRSPEYHVSLVYPVSNGQGLEEEVKALAKRNACTAPNTGRKKRWQLLRDLRAVEVRLRRELEIAELMLALHEWYRLSHPFLDPAKTGDDYLAAFLAELRKVRVPTGEGDTLNKALKAVSKLSADELPVIPGIPDAPERLRRVAALHRELSRLCGGKTYFLTCRDTARAVPGLSHQAAWNVNGALAQLGVVKVVRVGDPRPGGRASQFRYLLSQSGNGTAEIAA
jgi:CHC2 zinc finger